MYPIFLSCFSTRKLLLCLSASIFCLLYLPAIARATTGGPDDDGYVFLDSLESSCKTTFTDISSTGEVLDKSSYSDETEELALPFPFEFYGHIWNDLHISWEGIILFGITSPFENTENLSLPSPNISGSAILPYWDGPPISRYDVVSSVYYKTLGTEPDRRFIVQWHILKEYNLDNGLLIFQVVFYENSKNFDFVYGDVISGNAEHDAGASATIGIQKGSDTDLFLQYSYNDNSLLNSGVAALCFFHDVSLKNSVNFPQALPGDPITYTVQYKNSLPETLTNITIVGEFPDNFTVDKITNSGPPIRQVNTAPYEWAVDEIPPNSTIIIEIVGTIANNPALLDTTLISTAYITGSGIVDSRPVTTSVYIPDRPDLSGSVMQVLPIVGPNDWVTITVAMSNASLLAAVDTKLTIPIPPNITYVADSVTGGGTYVSDAKQIEWYGDIEPTSVVEISYVTLMPNLYTVITNTAILVQTQQSIPQWLITRTAIVPKIARGNFCADFEDGMLPPYILTETTESGTARGRVAVADEDINQNNYVLHLDAVDNFNYYVSGSTVQAAIMLLDMSEVEDAELSFWLNRYATWNRPSDSEDGVFISDDGGKTYVKIQHLYEYSVDGRIIINLDEMAAEYGLILSQNFRIKFQSVGHNSQYHKTINGRSIDGYSIDDICIMTELPEIEVLSNMTLISDGSLIPSESNNTEFGAVSIDSGRVERTFTIHNSAEQGNLLLQMIEIGGIHAKDFELVRGIEPMVLKPGAKATFDIAFSTSIIAISQAVVKIFSNDNDESIYNFTIQGHGSLISGNVPAGIVEGEEPIDNSTLYLPIIQR